MDSAELSRRLQRDAIGAAARGDLAECYRIIDRLTGMARLLGDRLAAARAAMILVQVVGILALKQDRKEEFEERLDEVNNLMVALE